MDYYKKIKSLIDKTLEQEITNDRLIDLYYSIGKILIKQNDKNLIDLENYLQKNYGIVIGFTRRNLINMINFAYTYKDDYLDILKNVSWKNHLVILKEEHKKNLLLACIKYNLDKNGLNNYIKTGGVQNNKNCLFYDDMLEELRNLKKRQKML